MRVELGKGLVNFDSSKQTMEKTESLESFYRHKRGEAYDTSLREIDDFNVFRLEDCINMQGELTIPYARRDFFKITMITGHNLYHYADKTLEINGTTLMFFNPQVPYSWEGLSSSSEGFFCIFKEAFFLEKLRNGFADLPMFVIGGKPSYQLDPAQKDFVTSIFRKMFAEIDTDYRYKHDLLVSYVTELIHYALKMEPTERIHSASNANTRITAVFADLLERQFPIESTTQRLALRSAKDFADKLFVHVNHLNRAVRETTGKTTSNLIAQRLTGEAKALLKHTDWSIGDIGYSLGFEEPAHFNHFFRKQVELSPTAFRSGK